MDGIWRHRLHLQRTQNTKCVSRWILSRKAVCAPARQPCQMARPCRNMRRSMLVSFIGAGTELRLDVLNIGDAVYEIRNGTGVGVAPQFGIRRAILAGLTQRF